MRSQDRVFLSVTPCNLVDTKNSEENAANLACTLKKEGVRSSETVHGYQTTRYHKTP